MVSEILRAVAFRGSMLSGLVISSSSLCASVFAQSVSGRGGNGNDVSKLTKDEMSAIAFAKFNGAKLSGKKDEFVRGLNALITSQPGALAAPSAPPICGPAPAAPSALRICGVPDAPKPLAAAELLPIAAP